MGFSSLGLMRPLRGSEGQSLLLTRFAQPLQTRTQSARLFASDAPAGEQKQGTSEKAEQPQSQEQPEQQQQQQQQQQPAEAQEKKIKELEAALAQSKDDLLRSLAERENLVRISNNNVENAKLYGIKGFAEGMLEVADNLERALESVPPEKRELEDVKALYEGVAMTEKITLQIFSKYGIKKFKPLNEKFDPKKHSALFEVQDTSKPSGTIVFVQAAGYSLHDRLLRPAQVGVIATHPETEQQQGGQGQPAGATPGDSTPQ